MLSEAAERKEKQLDKARKEVEQLTEETVSSYRLAGDIYRNNYAFEQALAAYERALQYITRERAPRLWALVVTQIGKTHCELGVRLEGTALHHHLSAAADACQQALEVQTKEQLLQDWAWTQTYLGTALREQGARTAGEVGQQLLKEAVAAYHRALEVQAPEYLPQDWALTQRELGVTLFQQGIRMTEEVGQQLLEEAMAAYRRALEVQTREHHPQDWARTQTYLGTALREQGTRTAGKGGEALLEEAIAVYRRALEVQTREPHPQDWAWMQTHLGTALREQGFRVAGRARQQLLEEAVAAYRGALEVRTLEALPRDWAQTQLHLAQALLALEVWSEAAASFAQLFQRYPDDGEAYYAASVLYHEKLFAFESAFSLSQQWLARHPEDLEIQSQFAEQCFTTGRFAEAAERITTLLANPGLESQMKIPLQALEIAVQLGLNQSEIVLEQFRRLQVTIAGESEDFSLGWTFAGTKYFISRNERLLPYRAWLLELFAALEEKDRNAILSHLE